jgi:hypothetical protein
MLDVIRELHSVAELAIVTATTISTAASNRCAWMSTPATS